MTISYNKLWKLLIDRGMKKGELKEKANISSSSMAKLGKNENVNTDILIKVCAALNCDLSEIMELVNKKIGENEGNE
jgi:DNA-binding Xre family transcriptional regulator